MHFALPPRKTSHPPPYARPVMRPSTGRQRKLLQILGYTVLGILTLYLLSNLLPISSNREDVDIPIDNDPEIVIVTVFDLQATTKEYREMVKTNRDFYAARHGYSTFYTNTTVYTQVLDDFQSSWAMVPALRHALKLYPSSTFLWYLSADALITNPSLSIESHILDRIETIMLKDIPVVPPDSVIHTFSHLKPSNVHLIVSQDLENIAHTSMFLRNAPVTSKSTDNWAAYFLDAWFDPLYRYYSFQKAENHALEHIIQWHPTILAKVMLIEQRLINSYNFAYAKTTDPETGVDRIQDSMWQPGDFVVNLKGCSTKERNCYSEMRQYFDGWMADVERIDGKRPEYQRPPVEKIVQI